MTLSKIYNKAIAMDIKNITKDKVKKYFKKYWKEQYINENDVEFKALAKLLENKQMHEKINKLQAFKDYVHQRLDEVGIEKEPNGEHSQNGCRIGDRLDIALWRLNTTPNEREGLEEDFFYNSSYTTSELLNADKNTISLNTEALFNLMAEYSLFRNAQIMDQLTKANKKIQQVEIGIVKINETIKELESKYNPHLHGYAMEIMWKNEAIVLRNALKAITGDE